MTKAWRIFPLKISMHIRVLHQDFGKKICEIKKKYPGIQGFQPGKFLIIPINP